MRIPRVYLPVPLARDAELELDERARHYVLQVLRLRAGAPLIIFNGEGAEHAARLATAEKRRATVQLEEAREPARESCLRIHLGLGISRGERMDYAIQKAVELGVAEITPLLSRRCVVRLDARRSARRREHWQGIVIGACEQCGRNRLPELHPPRAFDEWVQSPESGQALILDPRASRTLPAIRPAPTRLRLAIGPEGGFADEEIGMARAGGFSAVRFGPRILRTETAVVASLAAAQTLWGDLANDCSDSPPSGPE